MCIHPCSRDKKVKHNLESHYPHDKSRVSWQTPTVTERDGEGFRRIKNTKEKRKTCGTPPHAGKRSLYVVLSVTDLGLRITVPAVHTHLELLEELGVSPWGNRRDRGVQRLRAHLEAHLFRACGRQDSTDKHVDNQHQTGGSS